MLRTFASAAAAAIGFALLVANGSGFAVAPGESNEGIAFTCGTPPTTGGDICTVSRTGTELRRLTAGEAWDAGPTWAPDRSRIAFVRDVPVGKDHRDETIYRSELHIIYADGTAARRLVKSGVTSSPSWSLGGRTLIFSRAGDIWSVMDDGTNLRQLTRGAAYDCCPSSSPDGRRIAFVRKGDIFLIEPTAKSPKPLLHKRYKVGVHPIAPSWSHDGRSIAFLASDPGRLYVVNANGAGLKKLSTCSMSPNHDPDSPQWSPDGTKILSYGCNALYVISPIGGRANLLARRISGASWSPDGNWIAYVHEYGLFVMKANGTKRRQIARTWPSPLDW